MLDLDQIDAIKTKYADNKIGFTCSCFDILHAGHVLMLEEAKKHCDILVVGLQTDPTIDRPLTKNKPIQSFYERSVMIRAIRHVDHVLEYDTEGDLLCILKTLNPTIRIIGEDWKGKEYTGHGLDIPIYFNSRNHSFSTSGLRRRIYETEKSRD